MEEEESDIDKERMDDYKSHFHVCLEGRFLEIMIHDDKAGGSDRITTIGALKGHLQEILADKSVEVEELTVELASEYLVEIIHGDNELMTGFCEAVVDSATSKQIRKFRFFVDNNHGRNSNETTKLFTSNVGPSLPTSVEELELVGEHNHENALNTVPFVDITDFKKITPNLGRFNICNLRMDISSLCSQLRQNDGSLFLFSVGTLIPLACRSNKVRKKHSDELANTLRRLKKGQCR